MTTSISTVSIVVITRNRADDLVDCLRSCQSQRGPDFEILVVDNNSTDDTRDRVAREFPQVRLIAQSENRGVSEGRNQGIRAAKGDICIQIDDDAIFDGFSVVEHTIQYFDADPRLACVGYTIKDATTRQEETKSIPRRDKLSLDHDYETTYFCGAGFAVRRQAFVAAGMFWAPLVYGSQELDLSYRWIDNGWRLMHSAAITVLHKSSPKDRPMGQWVYFNTRDRPWVAVRNLPWQCVATTTALWWTNTLWIGLKRREIRSFLRGLRDCILGFYRALQGRRVIRRAASRRLRELSGRYWY